MLSTGIPELQSLEDINHLRVSLHLADHRVRRSFGGRCD
jgi:hypothetical protein